MSRHHSVESAALTSRPTSNCVHSVSTVKRNSFGNRLSLFLLNATSLAKPNAVQLLQTELVQLDSDCALITETWYTKKHLNNLVGIPIIHCFGVTA